MLRRTLLFLSTADFFPMTIGFEISFDGTTSVDIPRIRQLGVDPVTETLYTIPNAVATQGIQTNATHAFFPLNMFFDASFVRDQHSFHRWENGLSRFSVSTASQTADNPIVNGETVHFALKDWTFETSAAGFGEAFAARIGAAPEAVKEERKTRRQKMINKVSYLLWRAFWEGG